MRRWPLHPPPGDLEALSSWLDRLATVHGLSVTQLLGNLNLPLYPFDLPDLARRVAREVDDDPPPGLAQALAERTGVEAGRIHAMTLPGWQGLLLQTPDPEDGWGQAVFEDYVRANSVLLAPGEARAHQVERTRGQWAGPWIPRYPLNRVCPACVAEIAAGRPRGPALVWRLALMSSCVEHACLLIDCAPSAQPRGPVAVPEPLATMDRYTHQGLTMGRVDLPGRSVHAAVWFRLLRSLLDEVSLAPGTCRRQARWTLERVWAATGRPPRGGVRMWQVFEDLQPEHRDAVWHAAATALQMAADGTITARGRLADTIAAPPAKAVYAGYPPRAARPTPLPELTQESWERISADINATITAGRTDPDTAVAVLGWFLIVCRTPEQFERERRYVIGLGIPEQFLPTTMDDFEQAQHARDRAQADRRRARIEQPGPAYATVSTATSPSGSISGTAPDPDPGATPDPAPGPAAPGWARR
ncbi:MAG TPA: TniQ family protein [Streptomyces sp.]|uniref:TniQ family protein n=1 Tax=Streptomyces sp. TaxID=1931 RepID=UPI002D4A769D|nr:TniQ family protein [Streptomyces sp.]HZG06652.1 TniQ family protein [Streptomyces sp.]